MFAATVSMSSLSKQYLTSSVITPTSRSPSPTGHAGYGQAAVPYCLYRTHEVATAKVLPFFKHLSFP
jgi:hypothetical protein